jgi:LDH2 family malate/lactate/ureidoglycolate dehydrogenase
MDISEFKYISTISDPDRSYTGTSACWAIASDLISGALSLDRTVLGYEGHYLSYSKSFNIGNDCIVIDVSLDTRDVDNSIEIFIIKDNVKTPDNEKERVHYLGEKKFNNCKENALLYCTIANVIKRNLTQLFNGRNKKYCKVLSEVYEDDFV